MVRAPTGHCADADAAAHTVERGDGHRVLVNTLALAGLDVDDLGIGRSILGLFLGESEGTDGGVRADVSAVVALNALRLVPRGNGNGNAALFVSGSAELPLAVHVRHEGGNGQAVAVHLVHGIEDVLDLLDELGLALVGDGLVSVDSVGPIGGNVDLGVGGSAERRWPCGSYRRRPGPSSGRSASRRPSCTGWPAPRA